MRKLLFIFLSSVLYPLAVHSQTTVGLLQSNSAEDGYVLFAPMQSDTTYLIDKCGRRIHQWGSMHAPGMSVYLLPDGSLLRSGNVSNANFHTNGSAGGLIEKYDWNNNLLWSYTISSPTETQNHDIYPLANGNILVVIWEIIDSNTAIAAGRKPSLISGNVFSAKIEELQPIGTNQANVVWQWRLWDHLIQDFDATKSNYGVVADHPELVNVNYTSAGPASSDWTHANAVTYNASLDQIILSAHHMSELWFIDHNTTTAQAASHSGGAHSKGGDLLYRWGNPAVYGRGAAVNRVFYTQHNPTWIPAGYPHAGSIVVFNNGVGRPAGTYSSVDIFTPPVDGNGDYPITTGQAYGPSSALWSYTAAPVDTDFFGNALGGVQPMSNGNILVCEGPKGNFFEIDSNKNKLWQYVNPVRNNAAVTQGTAITNNSVFRCTQFDASYSGFGGQILSPHGHIEGNAILSHCDSSSSSAISEIENSISISVYPNPASDQLNYQLTTNGIYQKYTGTIYDQLGQIIESVEITPSKIYSYNTRGLSAGVYILKVTSATQSYSSQFVINK
ncbi:MAG: hypothetical protein JWO03_2429 [Bacteroidetes bacterium]|nr:hypothetical protein [Bacteroidota bacterium]